MKKRTKQVENDRGACDALTMLFRAGAQKLFDQVVEAEVTKTGVVKIK